jgi:ankyrin repeat protein
MVLLSFLVVMLLIPYETWEELLARTVGPGAYGGEFLVQAAAQDNGRFVKLLLRKGYDINFETGGTTPLSGASNGGHEEMVKLLISRGADLNRKNGISGESALMSAAEMGQLVTVKVLLSSGASRGNTTMLISPITSHPGFIAKKTWSCRRA